MKKIITLLSVSLAFFLIFNYSSSASYIFEEEKGLIYLGGYPIEEFRYEIDKIKDLYLKNKIYILDVEKNNASLLLETDNSIYAYEISNKGYICVSTNKKNNKEGIWNNDLIIYNKKAEIIKIINDVPVWSQNKFFSWSEDGSKIAYIKGKTIIEGRSPFEPEGVFIYDVEADKTLKIADNGVAFSWTTDDNNIYIQNKFRKIDPTDISMYNPSTGKLMKSDIKGIVLSDDGKYCILTEVLKFEFPIFKHFIFDNFNNNKIYKFKENGVQHEMTSNYKFITDTHYLLMWGSVSYKIFDVEETKNLRIAKYHRIIGWNKDMTKLIVYEGGGKFIHIESTLTGEKIKSIPIPEKE